MLGIEPDWFKVYKNKTAIEKDLHKFKYSGHGWYFNGTDTLLIMSFDEDERLAVYCWNESDARTRVSKYMLDLALAPVRSASNEQERR